MSQSLAPAPAQVFGNYVLLRALAKSGGGGTYLAYGRASGRDGLCVIKTRPWRDEDRAVPQPGAAPAASRLVDIFDSGRIGAEAFVAMELVDGRDLGAVWAQLCARGRPVPTELACGIAAQVLKTVSAMHPEPYGQLCPRKILLGFDGTVRLAEHKLTVASLLSGPAARLGVCRIGYVSSERIRRGAAESSDDLFALGVILWEMIAQRPLFERPGARASDGAGVFETLCTMCEPARIPRLSRFRPGIAPELEQAVMTALFQNGAGGVTTADQLREAILRHCWADDRDRRATLMCDLFGGESPAARSDREQLIAQGRALLALAGESHHTRNRGSAPGHALPQSERRQVQEEAPAAVDGVRRRKRSLRRVATISGIAAGLACVSGTIAWHVSQRPDRRGASGQLSRPAGMPAGERTDPDRVAGRWEPEVTAQPTGSRIVAEPPREPPSAPSAPVALPPQERPSPVAAESRRARPDHALRAREDVGELLRQAQDQFDQGSFQRALALAGRAIRLGGGARAHTIVGDSYLKLGDRRRAAAAYKAALKLAPTDKLAHAGLRAATGPAESTSSE